MSDPAGRPCGTTHLDSEAPPPWCSGQHTSLSRSKQGFDSPWGYAPVGAPRHGAALERPSSGPKPPPHVAEFLPPRGLSSPADTRLVFSLMPHPPRRRPSAAMVVALLALF